MPGDVGADPDADEHVAELRDRGVGEHLLDVVLPEADRRREERRERADASHHRAATTGASANSTLVRATRYTPAVTIVAAWISAETGVGPAIASGSQA